MSLEIDRALREGFDRTVSRNGLLVIGVFLVLGFVMTVLEQSASQLVFERLEQFARDNPELFSPESSATNNTTAASNTTTAVDTTTSGATANGTGAGPNGTVPEFQQRPLPFAIELPATTLAALWIVLTVLMEAVRIASIRVFAADQPSTVSQATVTHRIVPATINGVVAALVVAIIVGVASIFLLVPGIYAALSLYFVRQEVAVENKNFIDAIRDSWALAGGNRWELLGLAIILLVIGFVAGSAGAVVNVVDPMAGAAVSTAISAATTVFGIAVATRAYEQLRQERAELMNPEFDESDEI